MTKRWRLQKNGRVTGLNDDIVAQRQKIYLKQGKVDLAASEIESHDSGQPRPDKVLPAAERNI
jgi:hypothetical protein